MTVGELINVLSRFPKHAEVEVTWESTCHELDEEGVYQHADGTVLIDGDANFYKERFQTGELSRN